MVTSNYRPIVDHVHEQLTSRASSATNATILLSWLRNISDTDPVNALNNLIQAEHEDASTQVHGDITENFGVPQPIEMHNRPHQEQARLNLAVNNGFAGD